MKSLNHTIVSTIYIERARLPRKLRQAGSVLIVRTICITATPFYSLETSLV